MGKIKDTRRSGLGILPPRQRLLSVLFVTSAFAFVHSMAWAVGVVIVSTILIAVGPRVRSLKLLSALLLANTLFMLIGNVLFSPISGGGTEFVVFRLNWQGVYSGIIGALKRDAMLIVSFAWLSATTSPEEIRASLSFVHNSTWEKFALIFLRGIQTFTIEIRDHYYSLLARGVMRRTMSPRKRLYQMYLILNAVVGRFFRNVTRMTLAGESHFLPGPLVPAGPLVVHELVARYEESGPDALRGVGIELLPGDIICLLGENGSGKTTLLRCMSACIPRLDGEIINGSISMSGLVVSDQLPLASVSSCVRYVGSSHRDNFVGLTVGQELAAVAPESAESVELLHRLGLSDLSDVATTALSGGQQTRLLLATGLLSGAWCLLFDNPLSQLDEDGRRSFIAALDLLSDQDSRIVVFADESAEWYVPIANRYIVMHEGRVVRDLRGRFEAARDVYTALGYYPSGCTPAPVCATHDGMIMAELQNVRLQFEDHVVLDHVTLEVRSGECLLVLGANGSGKTTAMLTLAGVLKPTSGVRIVHGTRFGLVFQHPEDHILEGSCDAELRVGPRLQGWNEIATSAYAGDCIERLGLDPQYPTLELHPMNASMLACLCATAGAQVVIFDEPTSEMDSAGIEWFADLVTGLVEGGVGTVIITHDKRIMPLASRALVMDKGRVVAQEKDIHVAIELYKNLSRVPAPPQTE